MIVSFQPLSHGCTPVPGTRLGVPSTLRRASTLNFTRCTWIGWASSVQFHSSHASFVFNCGFVMTGSDHIVGWAPAPAGPGGPAEPFVPRRAAFGANGT